jgi:hypothetical protein
VRSPRIFFFCRGNAHEFAHLPVAASPSLESPDQALGIDTIRFYAPSSAIDFEARRVHDPTSDPRPFQMALQPESVIAGLEDTFDPDGLRRLRRYGTACFLANCDQPGRDRRSLAAFAGLAPSPFSSGRLQHDQGISKAGNSVVRARLVQLAWRWVRFQNGSDIAAWFVARTAGEGRRSRRVAIVAVARKLLVALWRYATQGLLPSGARLKVTVAG